MKPPVPAASVRGTSSGSLTAAKTPPFIEVPRVPALPVLVEAEEAPGLVATRPRCVWKARVARIAVAFGEGGAEEGPSSVKF
jgi:hypothetical protein